MRPLYDKCIAWIDAITPAGVTVYVRDQNAPAPSSPRVALRIGATTEIAHHRGGINEAGAQDVIRWHGFTLQMQIFGTSILEAEDIAQSIMDQAYFSELRIDLMGRNVAFSNVALGPTTINEVIGAEIEPRVTLDFLMSATRDLVYEVGPIEEVEIAGDVSGIASSRTTSAKGYVPGPTNVSLPEISGGAEVGNTVECSTGEWTTSSSGQIGFAFQWLRGGIEIAGATSNGYTLGADDNGKEISCRVTATDKFGSKSAASEVINVPFDDTSLFGASDNGLILDFSDKSRLYTDLLMTTNVTTSNDPIGAVEDKTGHGNHYVALNTASRPTYEEVGNLAHAVMGAAGSTSLALQSPIPGFDDVDDLTVIAIYSTHGENGERPILFHGASGVGGDRVLVNTSRASTLYRDENLGAETRDTVSPPDTSGDTFMVTIMKRGSEGRHYIDGLLVQTDTGLGTWGADLSATGFFAKIRGASSKNIYFLAIDRGLTDEDLSGLHDYAKAKGGIA